MFPARIYVGQIAAVFGIVIASTWIATLPFRELMQASAEEDGLKQQLTLCEDAPPPAYDVRSAEERLLEDEADIAADRSQMQRFRHHGSWRSCGHRDDLLPAF
jgi:type IV secretion system protein VirD4